MYIGRVSHFISLTLLGIFLTAPAHASLIIKDFNLLCRVSVCTSELKEDLRLRADEGLKKAPLFLDVFDPLILTWMEEEESSQYVNGRAEAGWNHIQVYAPFNYPIEGILVHELAHLYHEKYPEKVSPFLELKFYREEFISPMLAFWDHVNSLPENKGHSHRKTHLDETAKEMLEHLKFPKRSIHDFNAINKVTEYWATSVEIYYRYQTQPEALNNYFSNEEISFLEKLFQKTPKRRMKKSPKF